MDFAEAWETLAIGARVRVSDGTPQPPEGRRFFMWRSHNFEGSFVDRVPGPPRGLLIAMDAADGARVSYTVSEAHPHSFELL